MACGPGGNRATSGSDPVSVNRAPVAVDDSAKQTGAVIDIPVLANDTDPDGDALKLTGISAPVNGLAIAMDGGTPLDGTDDYVRYTPNMGFGGVDSFTYTIEDAHGATATAVVSLQERSPTPVALADEATTAAGAAVAIQVLDNDTDPNGHPLMLTAVSIPLHGTASVHDNGTPADATDDYIVYTPNASFVGSDSFHYTLSNGIESVDAVVSVIVGGAPVFNVSGHVMKGPVRGAEIALYRIDGTGHRVGDPLVSTITDASGYWFANVPDPREPLLVVSAGGSYIDETDSAASGGAPRVIELGPTDTFEGVLPASDDYLALTLYTNALLVKARSEVFDNDFDMTYATSRALAAQAFGFDLVATVPADPIAPDPLAGVDALSYAQMLGAAASVINDVTQRSDQAEVEFNVLDAFIRDFSDCTLDGVDANGPVQFLMLGVQRNMPTDLDLNLAALRFRNNNFSAFGNVLAQYDESVCSRSGAVPDTVPPVISLLGPSTLTVEGGFAYADPGATASDDRDGNLSGLVGISNPVDVFTVGTYQVIYTVADVAGNAASASRTVHVVDTTPPAIVRLGSEIVSVLAGTSYDDAPGATATDAVDGDLTAQLVVDNPVDINVAGTYVITYDVTDASGNAAPQVTRTVVVVDTTAPVITLLGNSPETVEAGSAYVDAGATAFDLTDGDLTASIVAVSTVDTSVPGTYTVTYDVSDSDGEAAAPVVRTVQVVDTTPPVVTLLGADPQAVEAGSPYVEAGATASDSLDGDISGSVVIDASAVDVNMPGTYQVTYDVSDTAGNAAAQVIRTVQVSDTVAPVITLLGTNPQSVEANTAYTELGATASDSLDGDLSADIVIDTSGVDPTTPGSYLVTYDVSDGAGNAAIQRVRTVNVGDTTPPVITLVGANPQVIQAGDAYVEQGATASDTLDGDLSASVVIDASAVNTSALGSYVVTYDVTDSEGNVAATVTRTVDVIDTTAPVIALVGANPQTIEAGSAYSELGATASDNLDGDLSASVVIDASAVNTSALGSYVVTYDVTDSQGNVAATVTRTVDVIDTTPPVITLLGNNPESVVEDSPYADAGAGASDNLDGDVSASIVTVDNVDTSLPGSYTVTYDVTDSEGNVATQAVRNVTVTPVNDAPTLDFAVADSDGTAGVPYSYDLSLYFSDEENDPLTFSIAGLPAGTGLAINSTTGVLSGTPTLNDAAASPISLTVKAEDPSLDFAEDTFLLTIDERVDLTIVKSVDDSTPNEGQGIAYTITLSNAGPSTATNIDIQDLQPAGVTFGAATPSAGAFAANVWSLPTLANGASETLIVNATVDAGTGGQSIVNVAELIGVDQAEADASESASVAITVPVGPSTLRTWVGGAGGPPGSETDWTRNGNWSPNGVPNTNDEIVIPITAFDPVLGADLTAFSLTIESGASLDIGPWTLTTTGEIRVDGSILGTGIVVAAGGTVRGSLPETRIDGDVTIKNNLTVNGDLTVLGELEVSWANVNGNLFVTGGTGILVMQSGSATLFVSGDAVFDGGDHSVHVGSQPPLNKGAMWLSGDFTQTGGAFSFAAEDQHQVILAGTTDQTITMMNPDSSNPNPSVPPATGSRFANLYLAKDQATDGDVILATDIAVLIELQSSAAYDPRVISPSGRRIVAGGAEFVLGTFDNVPIEFVDGGKLKIFSYATMQNLPNDIVQVGARRSEPIADVYVFDNLSFLSAPNTAVGGYYIEVENVGSAPLTLDVLSTFPASGAADSNTIGDFTLNW